MPFDQDPRDELRRRVRTVRERSLAISATLGAARIRPTYCNFFYLQQRWQMGLRLAKDLP